MSEIVSSTVEPLDLPLSEPFEISLGTNYEATNALVTIEIDSGVKGYGEGSPLPPVTGETQAVVIETAKEAGDMIVGESVNNYRRLIDDVRQTFPGMVSATFAVETAILDAYCREHMIPMAQLFGGEPKPVQTDMTIPILPETEAVTRATQATKAGYECLKVKTGTDVKTDADRVVAVQEAAPDSIIKVDANQGWTPKETVRFAEKLRENGVRVELIEQPVPASDIIGLADTRQRVNVPIGADEAVFTPQDAVRVVREDAADVINVKPGKSGLLGAADIISIGKATNRELMIGCMLESAIGIHASAHVVAGTGAFSYVDLDGNRLLEEDVIPDKSGPVHRISGPGHGVNPEF